LSVRILKKTAQEMGRGGEAAIHRGSGGENVNKRKGRAFMKTLISEKSKRWVEGQWVVIQGINGWASQKAFLLRGTTGGTKRLEEKLGGKEIGPERIIQENTFIQN